MGCTATPPITYTQAASVVAAQANKDETVLVASGRIEANNSAAPESPQKPLIQADVEVIRHAVASAPAADLEPILASVKTLAAERDKLTKDLAAAKLAIKEAQDSIWAKVQFYGAMSLYFVAIAALVLAVFRAKAAISSGLAIMEGVKSTMTLLTIAATCFSVARYMAAWWFWYSCAGIVLIGIGYVGYLVVMERKGKAAASVVTPIRSVLDRAHEEASPEQQKWMEKHIFEPIGVAMEKSHSARSYLHLDRAAERAA